MKKILAVLLAGLLVACMASCNKKEEGAGEQENTDKTVAEVESVYGDFRYVVNEDGNYEITGYTYTGVEKVDVSIPSTLSERPVTAIGDGAFKSLHNIKSVAIPDTVVTIGANAFYDCDFLTEIKIPASVTLIGAGAFENCSRLASVTFNRGLLEIGYSAFKECVALTEVALPDGLLTLGAGAFQQCTALTAITVPNTVIEVGDAAFYDCPSVQPVFEASALTAMNEALSAYAAVAGNTAPDTFAKVMEVLTAAEIDTEGLAENGGYKYTWDKENNAIVKTDDVILKKLNDAMAAYLATEHARTPDSFDDAVAIWESAGYYFGVTSDNGAKYVWDQNENVLYGAINAEDAVLLAKINAALKATPPVSFGELETVVKNAELNIAVLNVSVSSDKFVWDAENNVMTDSYVGKALVNYQ